jgi:hypothetical protein
MKEHPILFSGREEWKPVPEFEGRYDVSNWGRVRSLSCYRPGQFGKILSPSPTSRGYLSVCLRHRDKRRGYSVHRLVMAAFAGPCPDGHQVAHNNGCRTDNRVENLRYATPSSNIDDRHRHGRTARGSRNGSAILDEAAARTIKSMKGKGYSAAEVAHLACVSTSTVQSIWDNESWRHV